MEPVTAYTRNSTYLLEPVIAYPENKSINLIRVTLEPGGRTLCSHRYKKFVLRVSNSSVALWLLPESTGGTCVPTRDTAGGYANPVCWLR